jgi:hypothetical protein
MLNFNFAWISPNFGSFTRQFSWIKQQILMGRPVFLRRAAAKIRQVAGSLGMTACGMLLGTWLW